MQETNSNTHQRITEVLNKHPSEIPAGAHDKLRDEFASDGTAQMVIDGFDGTSKLFSLIKAYKNAMRDGKDDLVIELDHQIDEFKKEKYGIESDRE